ncbi:6-pyruvoyl trahydropterin synthase family protein [Ideonella sp. BN130291]|uniref:6-pyruvoyl trahydropterin synthase family protein n=1 Tax=Ideonella sp. BN130291 TaxID=3112940 RepID=UPI002E27682E|nr:6-carboxytetrahydropterin synthase [Ideonella sp. BN130291]
MFELSQTFYFEAAHTLERRLETESSRRIHGHTYGAEVQVSGVPDRNGMVVDLAVLRGAIAAVRDALDHHFLDDVAGLGPATLENLCLYIHRQVSAQVPGVSAVSVYRSASGDRCTYRPQ